MYVGLLKDILVRHFGSNTMYVNHNQVITIHLVHLCLDNASKTICYCITIHEKFVLWIFSLEYHTDLCFTRSRYFLTKSLKSLKFYNCLRFMSTNMSNASTLVFGLLWHLAQLKKLALSWVYLKWVWLRIDFLNFSSKSKNSDSSWAHFFLCTFKKILISKVL